MSPTDEQKVKAALAVQDGAIRRRRQMRPVLITTEYRGVFFGFAEDTSGDTVTLTDARNCIYWHSSVGGFGGLASIGPNKQCRLGAVIPKIELRKVTSVSEVSADAAKAWGEVDAYKG